MLRELLAAARRHLWRNPLYAVVNIGGLAVGYTAAVLIALFVRAETHYDRFWPHDAELYTVTTALTLGASAPLMLDGAPSRAIAILRQHLPASVLIARTAEDPVKHAVRRGPIEGNETVTWADPQLFAVLRPAVIAGDLDSALERPDSVVLTEHIARKYFGDARALGQLLELDHQHALRVTAVVRDIPGNSFLQADLFGSGRAPFAGLGAIDARHAAQPDAPDISPDIAVYLRLPPGYPAARVQRALQAAGAELIASLGARPDLRYDLRLLPVTAVHLSPPVLNAAKPRGDPALLSALILIGVGIVAMAAVNFVSLVTARAGRRAVEIGVRKAAGAGGRDLIVQFIGESALCSLVAMLIALSWVELLLPAFNGFLHQELALSYGHDLVLCLGAALLTALAAGFYPALVLARFRPASVLRGGLVPASGSAPRAGLAAARVRQVLVVLQFTVLISLLLATVVVDRQVQFALNAGLRFNKDQVLVVATSCRGGFEAEVRKLPGVRAAACSESAPLGQHISKSGAVTPDGTRAVVRSEAVEPGLFELYGVHPVAGRFFSPARTAEDLARGGQRAFAGPVVINETAVRRLHFRSPQAAIGQTLRHASASRTDVSQIIGVVPDLPVDSVRAPVEATVFHTDADDFRILSIKLAGAHIPETLQAIDALWRHLGEPHPIERWFVDQLLEERYLAEVREATMLGTFAGVAVLIAGLGLFGLAAYTAERRTKEIGVRKALGATRGEIIRMLLWELTRPVLVANLLAWPLGFYVMSHWLSGFAYRIDLAPWMFLAAALAAVAIAWLTVSSHAWLLARQRPVVALRYE